MKQKNMILVAVAVACGLAAAVLTSQISAGNKAMAEETVAAPRRCQGLARRHLVEEGHD